MFNHNKSEEFYLKALELRKDLLKLNPSAYKIDLAQSYLNLGCLYCYLRQYQKAKDYSSNAMAIFKKLEQSNPNNGKWNSTFADLNLNLGFAYFGLCQYDEAEECYLNALTFYKKHITQNVASCYNNLAVLYCNQERYDRAIKYYFQSLNNLQKLAEQNPNKFNWHVAETYNKIANTYRVLEQYDKALEYYTQTLKLRKEIESSNKADWTFNLGELYLNLGTCHFVLHQYDKAEVMRLHALSTYNELAQTDNSKYSSNITDVLGSLSYTTIFSLKFSKAEKYALDALSIDSTKTWIKTNLVISILFQGKYKADVEKLRGVLNQKFHSA